MGGFGVGSRCLCMLQYLICPASGCGERNLICGRLLHCLATSEVLARSQPCLHTNTSKTDTKTDTDTSFREPSQLWTNRRSHRHTGRETTPGSSNNRPPPFRGMVCLFSLLRPVAVAWWYCMAVAVVAEVVHVSQCFVTKQLDRPRLTLQAL